jgi:hypothetical protein
LQTALHHFFLNHVMPSKYPPNTCRE